MNKKTYKTRINKFYIIKKYIFACFKIIVGKEKYRFNDFD